MQKSSGLTTWCCIAPRSGCSQSACCCGVTDVCIRTWVYTMPCPQGLPPQSLPHVPLPSQGLSAQREAEQLLSAQDRSWAARLERLGMVQLHIGTIRRMLISPTLRSLFRIPSTYAPSLSVQYHAHSVQHNMSHSPSMGTSYPLFPSVVANYCPHPIFDCPPCSLPICPVNTS